MKRFTVFIVLLIVLSASCTHHHNAPKKPKIVIGLVIDQMRWDYLYRYYDLYTNLGFKRIMRDGYNCQETSLDYLPAFTGPGHSCIYTGSVPSINGIAGNNWIENSTGKPWYCVDDAKVHQVGDATMAPSMSPGTLLTTTITDELRLATNLKSRVFGIALKDRGSILPAGHLANAAYWYDDKSGNFTTSTYYPDQNPAWLQAFNKRHTGDSMVKNGWRLLYDAKYYDQSLTDANNYEGNFKGEKSPVFPHLFDTMAQAERYKVIKTLPAGNTYSIMMAKACIEGERLGMGEETDFLALSLSSTDYAGHQFAPNSIELEDMYLRLDQDIADFLRYLDMRYGHGNYLFFLTADHGGAHNATYLSDLDIPAGVESASFTRNLNDYLKGIFGRDSIVRGIDNYQVFLNYSYFNESKPEPAPEATPAANDEPDEYKMVRVKVGRHGHKMMKVKVHHAAAPAAPKVAVAARLDRDRVKQAIIEWLGKRPEIQYVIDMEHMDRTPVPEPIRSMVINGYYKPRSGDIEIVLNPGWYDNGGKTTGMTHGSWNPYDTHIPLLWYGWHVSKGETHRPVHMTDISATLAAMLNIQMPNGCIGKPITEITDCTRKHK